MSKKAWPILYKLTAKNRSTLLGHKVHVSSSVSTYILFSCSVSDTSILVLFFSIIFRLIKFSPRPSLSRSLSFFLSLFLVIRLCIYISVAVSLSPYLQLNHGYLGTWLDYKRIVRMQTCIKYYISDVSSVKQMPRTCQSIAFSYCTRKNRFLSIHELHSLWEWVSVASVVHVPSTITISIWGTITHGGYPHRPLSRGKPPVDQKPSGFQIAHLTVDISFTGL